MTQKKPPSMSWTDWISGQIEAARQAGEFDGLASHGKPLDLSDAGHFWQEDAPEAAAEAIVRTYAR